MTTRNSRFDVTQQNKMLLNIIKIFLWCSVRHSSLHYRMNKAVKKPTLTLQVSKQLMLIWVYTQTSLGLRRLLLHKNTWFNSSLSKKAGPDQTWNICIYKIA